MTSMRPPPGEQALLADVQSALASNDLRLAAALAQKALSDGVRHPLLYNLVAFDAEEKGRLAEAFSALQRALELAPQDPQTLHAVGVVLLKMGHPVQSLTAFDAALLHRPDFPATLHHQGLAFETLGEDERARALYARAAALDPAYPDPRAGLASIAARRGEADAALEAADAALALDPRNVGARMARASVQIAEGAASEAESALQALTRERSVPPPDRAAAFGLLGDALHAQGRAAEAVGAWTAGKREAVRAHAEALASAPRFLDQAKAQTQALAGRPRRAVYPRGQASVEGGARGLAFLVGFPRSGTTLLEQVLAAHPEVSALDERATLERLDEGFTLSAGGLDRLETLSEADADGLRRSYWRVLADGGTATEGRLVVDKLPLNSLRLPMIARLFPEARVLFALRDPRDVIFSCFRRTFRMNAAMREFATLSSTAAFYDAVMTAAAAAREVYTLKVSEVRYESVVSDFTPTIEGVCADLGIAYDAAMAAFADRAQAAAIATPSAPQIRRGLFSDGVGQWRAYAALMGDSLEIVDPWVRRLGYAP